MPRGEDDESEREGKGHPKCQRERGGGGEREEETLSKSFLLFDFRAVGPSASLGSSLTDCESKGEREGLQRIRGERCHLI